MKAVPGCNPGEASTMNYAIEGRRLLIVRRDLLILRSDRWIKMGVHTCAPVVLSEDPRS